MHIHIQSEKTIKIKLVMRQQILIFWYFADKKKKQQINIIIPKKNYVNYFVKQYNSTIVY